MSKKKVTQESLARVEAYDRASSVELSPSCKAAAATGRCCIWREMRDKNLHPRDWRTTTAREWQRVRPAYLCDACAIRWAVLLTDAPATPDDVPPEGGVDVF